MHKLAVFMLVVALGCSGADQAPNHDVWLTLSHNTFSLDEVRGDGSDLREILPYNRSNPFEVFGVYGDRLVGRQQRVFESGGQAEMGYFLLSFDGQVRRDLDVVGRGATRTPMLTSNGRYVAVEMLSAADETYSLHIFDVEADADIGVPPVPAKSMWDLSPSGTRLFLQDRYTGAAAITAIADGTSTPIQYPDEWNHGTLPVVWSPDESFAYTISSQGRLLRIDTRTGETTALVEQGERASDLHVTRAGEPYVTVSSTKGGGPSRLVSFGPDGSVRVDHTVAGGGGVPGLYALAPDGRHLAYATSVQHFGTSHETVEVREIDGSDASQAFTGNNGPGITAIFLLP